MVDTIYKITTTFTAKKVCLAFEQSRWIASTSNSSWVQVQDKK